MLARLFSFFLAIAYSIVSSHSNSKAGDLSVLAVNTSQHPSSVIKKVCSNCADLMPSYVVDVHLSGHVISFQVPWLIIGSTVNICLGFINPTALFAL